MSLGNVAFHKLDYQDAYEYFSRADREFIALGATDGMTLGLRINLGIASDAAFSRVEESRQIFLDVERDCVRLGLHHLEAQAKFNRARLEMLWGNYREAISLLETAEDMFAKEQAPELMAATQLTRAEAFVDLGMPDEAIDLSRRAGDTYRGCELELDAAVADETQALALRSEGRSTEALALLESVRSFYRGAGLPVGVALTELQIARTIRSPADLDRAAEMARAALGRLQDRGLEEPAARGRIVLAETLRRLGRADEAEQELTPALELVSRLNPRDRIDLWTVAGRVSRDAGRRWASIRRYRRAVNEVERERYLTPGADLKARAIGTDADRELIDLLLVGDRLRFGTLYRLVESVQGRRWRLGGAGGSGAGVWSRRRAELASLVRQVQQREAEGIASDQLDRVGLAGLRRQITEVESEILSGVRTAFFRRSPDVQGDAESGRVSPPFNQVRGRLESGQAVITYFTTAENVVCLTLRPDGCSHRTLDIRPGQVRSLLRDWQMQLESFALLAHRGIPNLEFRRPAADGLLERFAQGLLEPLLAELAEVRELIIVPHGLLHQVPFECLRIEGDYVDRRFRIRRLPSASLLADVSRQVRRPTGRDVVLLAKQNGPPGAEPEARAVARRSGADLLVDPTAAEVLEALTGARDVHWTTHGVLREDNPLFSHLAVRDGGFFLADLRGRACTVGRLVLSACDTGRVVSGRSDDVAGVAVAFLQSGVRELVAGLWRLHDEATVQFMENFYEFAGRSPEGSTAAALQSAYEKTRESWNHPFYWGGFAVYG
jgi:tetratricopeptide (TPR) repeat protein